MRLQPLSLFARHLEQENGVPECDSKPLKLFDQSGMGIDFSLPQRILPLSGQLELDTPDGSRCLCSPRHIAEHTSGDCANASDPCPYQSDHLWTHGPDTDAAEARLSSPPITEQPHPEHLHPASDMLTPMTSSRRRAFDWALLGVVIAAVGAAGFAAGRATAPRGDHQAAFCDDAQQVFRENVEAGTDLIESVQREDGTGWSDGHELETDRAAARVSFSTAYNAVTQNPACFTTGERARAQSYLDELNRQ